ncbi:Serine proteinase inhibitor 1 [Thelohanellus kitauei]|uniref:Serine proteinase inhibitor 1 n=1 Tax=Thelohanellus kitauei TaxID=669202 RepID=A0A0C2MP17_THEKT|nr:Serine proteinase inhibitor 1 [Thelohanellus kitauei]
MSGEVVNRFTFDVLNQLYLSQNSTGNIAFSGKVLYLIIGAISIGLRGRSHEKLSKFLHRDVDQSIDNEDWVKSENAKWWSELRRKPMIERSSKISIIYPGQLSAHYERISRQIFGLDDTQIDLSNAEESADEINGWISRTVYDDNRWNVVRKSMVSENKILLISTVRFELRWKTQFYKYRSDPLFYGENQEVFQVEMMSKLESIRIFIPQNNHFNIIFKPTEHHDLLLVIVVQRNANSIAEMLNSFKVEQLPIYFDQSEKKFVNFVLPKFKIPAAHDFVPALMKLGLTDIFYQNDTDFGRMTNHSVIMENLIQVTSVSVDEFGINSYDPNEVTSTLVQSHVDEFLVNRPFLFLLYSIRNDLVHFSALVKKP